MAYNKPAGKHGAFSSQGAQQGGAGAPGPVGREGIQQMLQRLMAKRAQSQGVGPAGRPQDGPPPGNAAAGGKMGGRQQQLPGGPPGSLQDMIAGMKPAVQPAPQPAPVQEPAAPAAPAPLSPLEMVAKVAAEKKAGRQYDSGIAGADQRIKDLEGELGVLNKGTTTGSRTERYQEDVSGSAYHDKTGNAYRWRTREVPGATVHDDEAIAAKTAELDEAKAARAVYDEEGHRQKSLDEILGRNQPTEETS